MELHSHFVMPQEKAHGAVLPTSQKGCGPGEKHVPLSTIVVGAIRDARLTTVELKCRLRGLVLQKDKVEINVESCI